MSVDEARHANVDSVEVFVGSAARLPHLRRLVHVSGYRVGGQAPAWIPWSEGRRARTYRAVGAWAASKMESGALLQTRAETLGVRWTIVNPASVIGDSVTGEADHADGGGGPGTAEIAPLLTGLPPRGQTGSLVAEGLPPRVQTGSLAAEGLCMLVDEDRAATHRTRGRAHAPLSGSPD